MRDTLFISPENIYERTPVHKNIDSKMIVPTIKVCQEIHILRLLGTAQYERLQDGIDNNNLTAAEGVLLRDYVRDCLIYHVVAELADTLSYQFWNKGVLRRTTDNTETPSQGEIFDIKNKYKNYAEYYGQRLARYLIEESGRGNFPLYINAGNRADTIHPKRSGYSIGIYLGNTDPNKNKDKPDWWALENITECE